MNLAIREFTEEDVGPAADLFVRVFSLPPWEEEWSRKKAEGCLQGVVEESGFLGYVMTSGHALLAAALGAMEDSGPAKHFRIAEIFVDPDHQRQGIGEALLEHTALQAQRSGAVRLTAATLVDTPAARFYLKQGFSDERVSFHRSCNWL